MGTGSESKIYFQSSCLIRFLGKQQTMDQVLGPRDPHRRRGRTSWLLTLVLAFAAILDVHQSMEYLLLYLPLSPTVPFK